MSRIYLDNAATTPIAGEVLDLMTQIMREEYGNPSSIHAEGRRMRALVEEARKTVARCIGAGSGEIFFTSGGTESNNMAIKCAVRDLGVRRIISSPLEHHCVLHAVQRMGAEGIAVALLPVDAAGRINLEALEALLSQPEAPPTLLTLMYANNEIGTLLPFERVAALCAQYGAYFHSDTVQAVGHYPINVQSVTVHFLSGAAHKFHGPKGVGFIYIRSGVSLNPYIDGGAQERNMRGGTENVYGIVGMAKALQSAYD
ncbi:MAG: cysteine desulfurase family protein, partial [Saprospiraceae bacterium]